MVKNKYTKKTKNLMVTTGIVAAAALIMSFGPMFFGPGMTEVKQFDAFLGGNFPDPNVSVEPYQAAFENITFNSPLNFNVVPGQDKIVIGQRDGHVYWIDDVQTAAAKQEVIDLSAEVGIVWDGGFLGLAIHPNFGTNGNNKFYIYYTTQSADTEFEEGPQEFFCGVEEFRGNYLILESFEVDPVNLLFVPGTREIMIKRQMYNTTHRGGGMEFGDDGYLYLSTGDQATYISAQQLDENLDGGVLRLDVDMIGGTTSHEPTRKMPVDAGEADEISGVGYFIPNDNPFVSVTGDNFEEYYTLGHRNPHRMTKDAQTGIFYIGEVGEIRREEINVVSSGKNYGWPVYEGNLDGPRNQCGIGLLDGMAHETPLAEFGREDAGALIGGYVYRGTEATSYSGKYICADWLTRNIFSVNIGDGSKENIGTLPDNPISFGQDKDGELYYLLDGDNVQLLRFVEPGMVDGIPQTLSETGAFSDLTSLTVVDGFLPYDMIDPFWSDGAYKKRWMAIPNDGTHDDPTEQIQFSENGVWEFPVGTVLIKHFDYPIDDNNPEITRKVETRFSVKASNGNFYFLTYNWNEDQTEAFLQDSGLDEAITIQTVDGDTRTIDWHFPSNSECLNCHNSVSKGTLGPRTRFLNSDFDYSSHSATGVVGNQLVTLSHLGIIDEDITDPDTPAFLTHKSINDPEASLDEKARSYLDLNCAYCHQPGTGNRGDFDLRLAKSLIETGLLDAGINNYLEDMPADQRILYPGDASKSQLYHRANSLTPGIMMPPLAKGQIDQAGVALLEAWINQLQVPPTTVVSADVVKGSASLPVQFTGSESTDDIGIASYSWDFGDGGTSTEADPLHNYLTPGRYTAELTVTDTDGNSTDATVDIFVTGGAVDNVADENVNLALLADVALEGSVENGRGTPEAILYDPSVDNYFIPTDYNEYGVAFNGNLGTPDADNGFLWQSDWISNKLVNYITFGGVFPNQPQPNSLWRISYRNGTNWTIIDEGIGGWLDGGIFEWGGPTETPIEMEALRIQVYSDGVNDLVNIHLRGRGGVSNSVNDSGTETKATLIQYLPDTGEPVSSFEYSAVDLEVTFDSSTSTDTNGIVAYAWDFGDGNTSTEEGPTHTYAEGGTYTVTLTVTDEDDLSDESTQEITVSPNQAIPVALASSNVNKGSVALNVQFTGSDSSDDAGITSYEWDFGDGGTSTEADPAYIYTIPGRYDAVLTVTDADGNTANATVEIFATGGAVDNEPNENINLALLTDAELGGSVENGRGTPQAILYDPSVGNYFTPTAFNEYGVASGQNLGTPDADNGFFWQTDWISNKLVNYVTFGGVYPNQPQPNSLWAISYRVGDSWTVLENGTGGWIDSGIYEWGGATQEPIEMEALRVQVYSDGVNDLVSIHLRGRGGVSNSFDDSDSATKATLIQYLPNTGAPESAFEYTAVDLEVTFDSSTATDDGEIVSYTWDFGNGNGSVLENPVHTYEEPGTYVVSLTVVDDDGMSDIATQEIVVANNTSIPVAIATSDVNKGSAPLNIQFTGGDSTDDVGIETYSWDFGDGNTSTGVNPNYTYSTPGRYTAVLTVTDGDGNEEQASVTIFVTGAPVDNAPNAGVNLALLTDVELEGSSNDGRGTPQAILYDPAMGNYFTPTDFNQYGVAFEQNLGTPTVDEGFLWQSDWISNKLVNYITFGGTFPNQPQPNSLWAISYRVGDSWTVLEQGTGGWIDSGIYEWGGPTQEAIEMEALRVQVYSDGVNDLESIHLRGRGGVSTKLDDSTIDIKATLIQYLPENGAPTSEFEYTVADLEVTFDASLSTDDIGIVSYAWDFGDGNTSTDMNPVHTYTESGTFTASLTVTNTNGISDTSSENVTIELVGNQSPIAAITTDVVSGEAPLTVNFSGSDSTDDIAVTAYSWNFDDGGLSSEESPTHTFAQPGSYTVTLTVEDEEGLTDNATVQIVVTNSNTDNAPNAGVNLALLSDAVLSGSENNGRGTLQEILYDPARNDYFVRTDWNEYGANFGQNLGTPDADNGLFWQVDWLSRKNVNYITIGGSFENQPQQNSVWTVSYRTGNVWTEIESGVGGWIDNGIYEWGGMEQTPIQADAIRVQVYSDGTNELISTHLRGRGGNSNMLDDRATATKATLIQYLPDAGAPISDFDFTINDLEVTFDSSNATDDNGIVSYLWDFGDGNMSDLENPIHTYFESGTYVVSLTVIDGDNKSDTSAAELTVIGNGRPIAEASSDVATGDAPLSVSFIGSTSIDDVGVVTYAWDFGDGGSSAEADPTYVFETPGEYNAELTVTDAEGLTDTATVTITVTEYINEAPIAIASSDVATGDAPLSVSFIGSTSTDDVAVETYAWEFGDGGSSTEADPTFVFETPGEYNAVLTVTDAEGLTDTATVTITVTEATVVNEAPIAIASSDVATGDAPLSVSFIGSTSTDDVAVETYAWDFGDGGSSIEADPTYVLKPQGSTMLNFTVIDDDGLTDTATVTITVTEATVVNEAPIAIASSDVATGDAPLSVIFTGSSSTDDVGIETYSWNFGDGGNSAEADPTYVFETPGEYNVELTVTDAEGLADTATVTITVTEVIDENEAPIAIASSDVITGDAPLSVIFTGSSSTDDVGIETYSWNFGDGGNSAEADPTYVFETPGEYNVELTVTDAEGLADSATVTIIVTEAIVENEAPIAIASSDVITGDAPLSVIFTGSSSTDDVGIETYSWNFGDGGNSAEADPTYVFETPGEYNVELTVTDAEGLADSATVTIIVTEAIVENEAPIAIASSDVITGDAPLTVVFTGSLSTDDVGIETYAWDFGDGGSSTEADPSYEFTEPGTYDVTLTVTDIAGLESTTTLQIVVAENEPLNEIEVEVILAPNPTIDFVEVILNNAVNEEDIIGFMLS